MNQQEEKLSALATPLEAGLAADAKKWASFAYSPNSQRAYGSDWRAYAAWCQQAGLVPYPLQAQQIGVWLGQLAERGQKISNLRRKASSLCQLAKQHGTPLDKGLLAQILRGIARLYGQPVRHKEAITPELLANMLPAGNQPRQLRDRALLLLGYAGALRRSELVALRWEDITASPEGLWLLIRRSKTDTTGAGQKIAIPASGKATCPVAALEKWRQEQGGAQAKEFVFIGINRWGQKNLRPISPTALVHILKAALRHAGIEPNAYAGHSLRRGFLSAAAAQGANLWQLLQHSRHRRVENLQPYIQLGQGFSNHPGIGII